MVDSLYLLTRFPSSIHAVSAVTTEQTDSQLHAHEIAHGSCQEYQSTNGHFVLTRPLLRRILVFLGVKQRMVHQLTEMMYQLCATSSAGKDVVPCLPGSISIEKLILTIHDVVPVVSRSLLTAAGIHLCTRPVVFLLGGTSGSGKTTLASLTAARFGITSVVAVDSVRDVVRGISDIRARCPVLMASTYEAHRLLPPSPHPSTEGSVNPDEGSSGEMNETYRARVIEGFTQQSHCVLAALEETVILMIQDGQSVVVEGVNLLVPWMYAFHCKLEALGVMCLPFVVHLSNPQKHLQRFAVRSKHMQLTPQVNKYAKNFTSVRIIQDHFLQEAQRYNVPRITNTNVDRSVTFVHYCLTESLRMILASRSLINRERQCFTIPMPKEGMQAYAKEVRQRIFARQHSRWNSAPPPSQKVPSPSVNERWVTPERTKKSFPRVSSGGDDESVILGS